MTVYGEAIDKDGGVSAPSSAFVTVNNTTLSVTTPSTVTATATVPFSVSATFTYPDTSGLSPYTATLYPDGTAVAHAYNVQSGVSFTLNCTYPTTSGSPHTLYINVSNTVGATGNSGTFQATVQPLTLSVLSVTPVPRGLDIQFNEAIPFSTIQLYSGSTDSNTPDVVVTGPGGVMIRGSVVWDSTTDILHFVRTSTYVGTSPYGEWTRAIGPLPAGNYTVTFNNPADWGGVSLAPQTVTIAATSGVYLTLPDIARGPDQPVNALADGTAGNATQTAVGIPIAYNPNGESAGVVTAVDFNLTYNPADLTVSGLQLDSALTALGGWTYSVNVNTPGLLSVSVYDNSRPLTPLPSSVLNLVDVLASVPSNAAYGAGALLKLTNVQVNGGSVTAAGDDAVQKVAYFGDATGYQSLVGAGGQDASDIAKVVVNLASGFAAYPVTDPIIIGNVSGTGSFLGSTPPWWRRSPSDSPFPRSR